MKKLYIAKKNTWYDEGTLVANIADETYFLGLGVCTTHTRTDGLKYNGLDEEGCGFDEFNEYVVPDEIYGALIKTFEVLRKKVIKSN